VIDLHTHTTASDGRLTPEALVARAATAGVTTLGVTDHDTVAACAAVSTACTAAGLQAVHGIEVTAVLDRADVHVLGYFIDIHAHALLSFLAEQRRRRIDRVREIVERLAAHGIRLDVDAILAPGLTDAGKAAGRPWVARALVDAGHASCTDEAFERWLGRGRPAFVPRVGASATDVIARLHEAGGLASLAHPGLTAVDEWIPEFVDAGLDAIEVYHSRHDVATTGRYLQMAARLKILVTGGSDFHGESSHGPAAPGSVVLPPEAFDLWLDCANVDTKTASALIVPAPVGLLEAYEVSTAVNRVVNDTPALLDPAPPYTEPTPEAKATTKSTKRTKKDDRQTSLF